MTRDSVAQGPDLRVPLAERLQTQCGKSAGSRAEKRTGHSPGYNLGHFFLAIVRQSQQVEATKTQEGTMF
jgi:hypothetical protein